MKKYNVFFEEVVLHEFPLDAENLEMVEEAFSDAADNGNLDFSDGDVILSQVVKIEDIEEGRSYKMNDSFEDLEAAKASSEEESSKKQTFNIFSSDSLTQCRIESNSFLEEFKEMAEGGVICNLDVMLAVMRDIKEKCSEKGYEAVFRIY